MQLGYSHLRLIGSHEKRSPRLQFGNSYHVISDDPIGLFKRRSIPRQREVHRRHVVCRYFLGRGYRYGLVRQNRDHLTIGPTINRVCRHLEVVEVVGMEGGDRDVGIDGEEDPVPASVPLEELDDVES